MSPKACSVHCWLLYNSSMDGNVCLRDDTVHHILMLSTSMDYKRSTISDWLNPPSLGTIPAFGCIDNLVQNSTCLINYH